MNKSTRYALQTPTTPEEAIALLERAATRGQTLGDLHGLSKQLPAIIEQLRPKPADIIDALMVPVREEMVRALNKFPTWPTDAQHASNILGEEYGELVREIMQLTYEPHLTNVNNVRVEAIQTVGVALRFLAGMDFYQFKPAEQIDVFKILADRTAAK